MRRKLKILRTYVLGDFGPDIMNDWADLFGVARSILTNAAQEDEHLFTSTLRKRLTFEGWVRKQFTSPKQQKQILDSLAISFHFRGLYNELVKEFNSELPLSPERALGYYTRLYNLLWYFGHL